MNILQANKIKLFFNKHFKALLFCFIFILICCIYNQNIQHLNYIFKRGTILEYSLPFNSSINEEKIEEKLISEGITYSLIKNIKNNNSTTYDSDEKIIKNLLQIGLPILPKENKKELFNNVTDYILENHPNSKLLNIKTLNNYYHKPFSSFLKFLGLFSVTFLIWAIILITLSKDKNYFKNILTMLKENLLLKIENLKIFAKKTKEKGTGYFFKKLLFEDTTDENGEEKEPDIAKETISTIVFVIVCVILIRYFIGELRWIPSGSMRPTILEKDRVFVEKLEYPKKEIKRGDILVFYPPEVHLLNTPWAIFTRLSGIFCKDVAFIKRVVGLPNDKFEVKFNEKTQQYRVYINDKPLNEPYVNSKTEWTPCIEQMHCGPFTIPENNYFMMGDNRGNSQDSRFWGFLSQDRIIGRANVMFWPISRINVLKDKYINLHKEKQGQNIIEENYIINRYEFLYKI